MATQEQKAALREWAKAALRELQPPEQPAPERPVLVDPWAFHLGSDQQTPVRIDLAEFADPVEVRGRRCVFLRYRAKMRRQQRPDGSFRKVKDFCVLLSTPAPDEPAIEIMWAHDIAPALRQAYLTKEGE